MKLNMSIDDYRKLLKNETQEDKDNFIKDFLNNNESYKELNKIYDRCSQIKPHDLQQWLNAKINNKFSKYSSIWVDENSKLIDKAMFVKLENIFNDYFKNNHLNINYNFIKSIPKENYPMYMFTENIFAFIYQGHKYVFERIYGQGETTKELVDYDKRQHEHLGANNYEEIGNWLTLNLNNIEYSINK